MSINNTQFEGCAFVFFLRTMQTEIILYRITETWNILIWFWNNSNVVHITSTFSYIKKTILPFCLSISHLKITFSGESLLGNDACADCFNCLTFIFKLIVELDRLEWRYILQNMVEMGKHNIFDISSLYHFSNTCTINWKSVFIH